MSDPPGPRPAPRAEPAGAPPHASLPLSDPRALRRWLLAGVAVISGLGLAVELWHARSQHPLLEDLVPQLSLSYEHNVPTWFSSSLLLACALAAGAIARGAGRWRRHWWGVTAVFAYASLDEAAEIHEHLGGHIGTSGVLYFDWVIPAIAIVGVLAAVFLPFVRALPAATRNRLIVAGVIYVGGAVGMELPLGWWVERAGPDNLGYALIDWIEETLEMIGASLAVVALAAHEREAPVSEANVSVQPSASRGDRGGSPGLRPGDP